MDQSANQNRCNLTDQVKLLAKKRTAAKVVIMMAVKVASVKVASVAHNIL